MQILEELRQQVISSNFTNRREGRYIKSVEKEMGLLMLGATVLQDTVQAKSSIREQSLWTNQPKSSKDSPLLN